MATENLKSAAITNATAVPIVLTNSNVANGLKRQAVGYIAPLATADVGSTYRFCRVPSNCRISALLISCAAFTTTGNVDLGIYQTAENGGAAIDTDFFADALALTSAKNNSDQTYQSGEYTFALSEGMLWQALGLSADPCRDYDIVATITTIFSGGQPMLVKVDYVT